MARIGDGSLLARPPTAPKARTGPAGASRSTRSRRYGLTSVVISLAPSCNRRGRFFDARASSIESISFNKVLSPASFAIRINHSGGPRSVAWATPAAGDFAMFQSLEQFVRDESGATAIEYGLIASLIAVVIIGALSNVGNKLTITFTKVAGNLH
jgi:pilus assembly protein Flp/PilA